jgi:DNA polymerase-3 subunit delta
MAALKAAEIDRFLARPDPARAIVLLFGPDAGLVRERAEGMIRLSVDDPNDPFSCVRLEGEDLSGDPLRLVEEANTIPLFGGRRAVWVKAGGRNIVAAVEALVAAPASDCRVVIEAGDLKRSAPLRTLCERAQNAVAIACYADGERDLIRLINEEMSAAGLAISAEARAALTALIGGDRQASRNEIRKLALYARGTTQVGLDDVLAIVTDASALALDGLIDAAFAGRPADVETGLARARAAGTPPATILSAALRQLAQLHKASLAVEAGTSPAQAVESMQPFVNFRRKPLLEAALRAWSPHRLVRAMGQLAEAILDTRRQPALAEALAQRSLLSLAVGARRKG